MSALMDIPDDDAESSSSARSPIAPLSADESHRDRAGSERLVDELDEAVEEHPWIERTTRIGWTAKGLVYTLMGVTAIEISQHGSPSGDASPEGSIARIAAAPLGRLSLVVMAAGLGLYVLWRLLSVAVIRGNGLAEWADRIGYSFSAIFYLVLCWIAVVAAYRGDEPEESSEIERLSQNILDASFGRYAVGAAGIVIVVVGLYFAVHKGMQRSFADDLRLVRPGVARNEPHEAAIAIAGIAGWVGRGVVTVLVGFFLLRSGIEFDRDDARGFDRSLRALTGGTVGATFVFVCGIGLILYGMFCFASHRRRQLEDTT